MHRKTMTSFGLLLLLGLASCQSQSPRLQPVAVACPLPPAPPAWVMEPVDSGPSSTETLGKLLSP